MSLHHPDHNPYRHFTTRQRVAQAVRTFEGMVDRSPLLAPRSSLSLRSRIIEWERPEECDSHSTIRWIVIKSGVVLRHRHCPPHEC